MFLNTQFFVPIASRQNEELMHIFISEIFVSKSKKLEYSYVDKIKKQGRILRE